MNLEEYASYDALGLADLVRRRQVAPAELKDLALRAIERLNPVLNAVVAATPQEAESAIRSACASPSPPRPRAAAAARTPTASP